MLTELSIRNFAIIDDLRIRFSRGLTILSGETGAGKSIIINAVNLLLGSRASPQLIRSGSESAELEAQFRLSSDNSLSKTLVELGYDAEDGLLIRRIISRADRSRTYINGRMVTAAILTKITENLASISGQHAHQGLLQEDNHLLILDQLGGLLPLRSEIHQTYHEMQPVLKRLEDLVKLQDRQSEQTELYRFQKREIADAAITKDEDKSLEQERIRLKNGAALYQTVYDSIETLYSRDGAVIETLITTGKHLEKAGEIDPTLSRIQEDLSVARFHLEDITENLRGYLTSLQTDEQRLEEVEARIDALHRLKRKYGGTLDAVLNHLKTVTEALLSIENIPEKIEAVEKTLATQHKKLCHSALGLSKKRKQTAESLARKVESELATLRMDKTKFEVTFDTLPVDHRTSPYLTIEDHLISEYGMDRVEFLIAPNVGEPLKPLAGIVSGGELSRVVLALKAILAETESVETVVFDEVDAGIGGGVAEVVGKKLAALSRYHQVICITHLPQIAKFGAQHFQISKHVSDGRTRTDIRPLNPGERVEEIARMLGGEKITEATLSHARELLENS
ncbi:MAG TPA: DNA repair protein RecN [Deltaproteobacteria bacterium]|nr:DNA repair protein RecN [Deltaproteobacteria bacterium]